MGQSLPRRAAIASVIVLAAAILAFIALGGRRETADAGREGDVPLPPTVLPGGSLSIASEEDARAALSSLSPYLGIGGLGEQLGSCEVYEVGGETTYRFELEYEGIPIYGRGVSLCAENGGDVLVSGNAIAIDGLETEPLVGESAAREAVVSHFGAIDTLMPLGLAVYTLDGVDPCLSHQYLVASPSFYGRCFISATTGEMLSERGELFNLTGTGKDISGETQSFGVETYPLFPGLREENTYYLYDDSRGIIVYDAEREGRNDVLSHVAIVGTRLHTYHLEPTGEDGRSEYRWFDVYGQLVDVDDSPPHLKDWTATNADGSTEAIDHAAYDYLDHVVSSKSTRFKNKEAVTLAARLANVVDFYAQVLSRRGFNGKGGHTHAVCDAALGNAFGAPLGSTYGLLACDNGEYLALDVIGHEYTHVVITSMVPGFAASDEAGILSEALGDVFGELVEDYWEGECDWKNCFRNYSDPGSGGLPTRYLLDGAWVDLTPENDFVHHNSTVVSHAAYLMFEGRLDGAPLTTEELATVLYAACAAMPSDCDIPYFACLVERKASDMLDEEKADRVRAAFAEAGITPPQVIYQDGVTVATETSVPGKDPGGRASAESGTDVSDELGHTVHFTGADLVLPEAWWGVVEPSVGQVAGDDERILWEGSILLGWNPTAWQRLDQLRESGERSDYGDVGTETLPDGTTLIFGRGNGGVCSVEVEDPSGRKGYLWTLAESDAMAAAMGSDPEVAASRRRMQADAAGMPDDADPYEIADAFLRACAGRLTILGDGMTETGED